MDIEVEIGVAALLEGGEFVVAVIFGFVKEGGIAPLDGIVVEIEVEEELSVVGGLRTFG